MNRKEYIAALEKQLLRLPKSDRDEVLNDFETHFDNETASGLTEDEISAQLGDPAELAAVYLENLPEGSKGEEAKPASEPETEEQAAAEAASEPAYLGQTSTGESYYSAPQQPLSSGTAAARNLNTENLVVYVLLFVFGFVPAAGALIGLLFGILGTVIGCFSGAAALVALGGVSVSVSVSGGIGIILIGIAVLMLGALLIVGLIAAIKGVVWLVKWFIKWSKDFLAPVNK